MLRMKRQVWGSKETVMNRKELSLHQDNGDENAKGIPASLEDLESRVSREEFAESQLLLPGATTNTCFPHLPHCSSVTPVMTQPS